MTDESKPNKAINISDNDGDIDIGNIVSGDVQGDVIGGDKVAGDKVAGDKVTIGGDVVFHLGGKKVILPLYTQLILGGIAIGILFLVGYQVSKAWEERPPSKMPGGFNIAVAEFTAEQAEIDELDVKFAREILIPLVSWLRRLSETDELDIKFASELARYLRNYEQDFVHLSGEDITIWGDEITVEAVDPATEEEAEKRANTLNANILVYGSFTKADDYGFQVEPKFHLSVKNSGMADELRGTYSLGEPIPYLGSNRNINDSLKSRIEDFVVFLGGIESYSSNRTIEGFQEAAEQFETLVANENTKLGKDVLYLFLGASYWRQASCFKRVNQTAPCYQEDNPEKRTELLLKAQQAYLNAIEINPNYSRAHIGQGAVYYELAQPLDFAKQCDDWDWDILQSAQDSYENALDADDKSELGAIEIRANLGIGGVYFWQGLCNKSETAFENALDNLKIAVTEFENLGKPAGLTSEVMMAYANLGNITLSYRLLSKPLPNTSYPLLQADEYYSRAMQLADIFIESNANDPSQTGKIREIAYQKKLASLYLIGIYCLDNHPGLVENYLNTLSEANRAEVKRDVLDIWGDGFPTIKECINNAK